MSHAHDFRVKSKNPPLADHLTLDYRDAALDDVDRALCDYAVKLSLRPGDCGLADAEQLRAVGLDDQQITLAVQIIGYFNYINRAADGLGVDDEEWMSSMPRDEWFARKGRFGA